ncbi:MAG: DegT/DnrJ/EryC1/StrS family aminotransferase [Tissierellia bacterium]|nr:DegT/DnrJ/EryC1/StrS family aminotransferase [Tissierellia bacterium]
MEIKKFENRLWLSSPTMYGQEQEFIKEAFASNWIAPLGPNVNEFEKELANYVGIGHAAATSAGTASLHLAYKLAGVGKGDIVLCPTLTFSATVNPISYENGLQVFVDSERETWNMDPRALELALKKYEGRVKAVSLVHLYGVPAKIDEVLALCKKYDVCLIEDAAESLSASYKGRQTGSFGRYNIFSFNGNKIITTSGGGMLVSDDEKAIEKAKFWSTQARDQAPWYQHSDLGYNYRMSNVLAGIGRGQLLHLEDHKKKKRKIYMKYKEAFKDLALSMNPYLKESDPNFWLSCILIDKDLVESKKVTPEMLRLELEKYNIESRPIWKPMHLQPYYKDRDYISYKEENVAEDIFNRGLCLPSDVKMTDQQQDIVIEIIRRFFK